VVFDAKISIHWVDTYYLFLNNYLQGVLAKREGSWRLAPNKNQDYNSDDILILAEFYKAN